LLKSQRADGHWVFELEADATIPSEYVLLVHYLAETPNLELERKIGNYLRRIQSAEHGGWPLYHAGAFDISATVKAYFALKMIGDDIGAPHMVRAREAIRARGGAIKANVFTRILLALYGETSWLNVPTVPVELILLPRWFPIHLSKMSYWARTVIVPLLVLAAKQPVARNPRGIHVPELFVEGVPVISPRAPHQSAGWSMFFNALDDRAAERRGRARRDLSRHGQFGDDVRRAGRAGERSAPRHCAQICRAAARRQGRRGLLPALRLAGVGHRTRRACADGSAGRRQRGGKEPRMAEAPPGARREGRLGGGAPRRPPRRLGVPVQQRLLSRPRRHRGGGDGARPLEGARRLHDRNRARPRMGRRPAVEERRLGRVRRGQRLLLPEQHSVRRSRRAARSADRRRDGPLHRDADAAGCDAGRSPCEGGRGFPAQVAAEGWLVVRPLGRQLHLR